MVFLPDPGLGKKQGSRFTWQREAGTEMGAWHSGSEGGPGTPARAKAWKVGTRSVQNKSTRDHPRATTEVPGQGTHCRLIGVVHRKQSRESVSASALVLRGRRGAEGTAAGAVAEAEATLSDPGGGQVADGACRKLCTVRSSALAP